MAEPKTGMTRTHYTALAELSGKVAAGRIAPWEFIEEMANVLEGLPGNFKRDKFIRHAEKETPFHYKNVGELTRGDHVIVGDSLVTVREVYFGTNDSREDTVVIQHGGDDDSSYCVEDLDGAPALMETEFLLNTRV